MIPLCGAGGQHCSSLPPAGPGHAEEERSNINKLKQRRFSVFLWIRSGLKEERWTSADGPWTGSTPWSCWPSWSCPGPTSSTPAGSHLIGCWRRGPPSSSKTDSSLDGSRWTFKPGRRPTRIQLFHLCPSSRGDCVNQ